MTAEQNCRLLTWSASQLRQYLTCDSHLSVVFDLLVGSDVASKLSRAKCRQRHHRPVGAPGVTRSSPLRPLFTHSHRPERPEQLPLTPRLPLSLGEQVFKCNLEAYMQRCLHTGLPSRTLDCLLGLLDRTYCSTGFQLFFLSFFITGRAVD